MTMIRAVGAENSWLELEAYGVNGGGVLAPSISSAQKRSGAYSYLLTGWWYLTGGPNYNYITVGFASTNEGYLQIPLRPTKNPGAEAIFAQFVSGTLASYTIMATICVTAAGLLTLYTGDKASLLGTSTHALNLTAWNVLELYFKIADSGGRYTLKLNRTQEIDFTGDNKPGTETTLTGFSCRGGNDAFGLSLGDIYVDDIIVNDTNVVDALNPNNSWVNGKAVAFLKITGAGNYSEWTPSTGDNYECVNEATPSLDDFIMATLNGKRDTYAMDDCPTAGVGSIAAVIPTYFGFVSGTPACPNMKRLLRNGGVDKVGSNIALPTAFGRIAEVLEISPFTNLPFTKAEIDGTEVGQQSAT